MFTHHMLPSAALAKVGKKSWSRVDEPFPKKTDLGLGHIVKHKLPTGLAEEGSTPIPYRRSYPCTLLAPSHPEHLPVHSTIDRAMGHVKSFQASGLVHKDL
jgi:hypothetical protein